MWKHSPCCPPALCVPVCGCCLCVHTYACPVEDGPVVSESERSGASLFSLQDGPPVSCKGAVICAGRYTCMSLARSLGQLLPKLFSRATIDIDERLNRAMSHGQSKVGRHCYEDETIKLGDSVYKLFHIDSLATFKTLLRKAVHEPLMPKLSCAAHRGASNSANTL